MNMDTSMIVLILVIVILTIRPGTYLKQLGGETCTCDPTGDDVKRCPAVKCKKQGLALKYYTTDRNGTRRNWLKTEIHNQPINYNWDSGNVLNSGRRDNARLEFQGYIKAPVDGDLEFRVQSDDGIRVFIDGQPVIDQWKIQGATYHSSAPIKVYKDDYYPFKLEWYEHGDGAVVRLMWRYNGGSWNIVPAEAYFHDGIITPKTALKKGLSKIIVTTAVTWNQAQALARKSGGRLPTDQEFKTSGLNAGSRDLWMPASHSSGRVNDWVQIGRHAVPRYSYHIPTYGPPRWGLNNQAHAWRPRPNDAFNYIYIMNGTNDDWVCLKDSMGDINVPIKKVGEDPACLSNNGRDCLWNKGHCKDGQRTTTVLPSTSSIKPLVCGAHHQKQYGSTGYVNPQHWCKRSKDMMSTVKAVLKAGIYNIRIESSLKSLSFGGRTANIQPKDNTNDLVDWKFVPTGKTNVFYVQNLWRCPGEGRCGSWLSFGGRTVTISPKSDSVNKVPWQFVPTGQPGSYKIKNLWRCPGDKRCDMFIGQSGHNVILTSEANATIWTVKAVLKSPTCSLRRGQLIYNGCGYAYQTKKNRDTQCGRNDGTSPFIWDDKKKSACGIKRGQLMYTGCGYTYQMLRDRNQQCGRGGSIKFIPAE
jgi:hypothetical protein